LHQANYIWNIWNLFWRSYFLLYLKGGLDIHGTRVSSTNNYSVAQNAGYLKRIAESKQPQYPPQAIVTRQEPLWGDEKTIVSILSNPLTPVPNSGYALALLNNYLTDIKHFQIIRNAFIHLNGEKISEIKTNVVPGYRFLANQKEIDILHTISISTNKLCVRTLIDSMEGMLNNL